MLDADGGTFAGSAHVLALNNRFMLDHFAHIAEWADWALEQAESWPDTTTPAETHRAQYRAILEASLDRELDGGPSRPGDA
jgi:hypothetical protein